MRLTSCSIKALSCAVALCLLAAQPATARPVKAKKQLAACVQGWANAFRQELGPDRPISVAQLDEWEQWCRKGRRPGK